MTSFEAFYCDVGPCPGPEYTLDRIDNDRNYEPGNVRWATRAEQQRNKRTNRMLTFNGETRCLEEWARMTGLGTTLRMRLRRGWGIERALSTPKAN